MNEHILVEFIVDHTPYHEELLAKKLIELGADFEKVASITEWIKDEYGFYLEYVRISGKINSMAASALKLQDPYLATRMRISHIDDDLKDKYRK